MSAAVTCTIPHAAADETLWTLMQVPRSDGSLPGPWPKWDDRRGAKQQIPWRCSTQLLAIRGMALGYGVQLSEQLLPFVF